MPDTARTTSIASSMMVVGGRSVGLQNGVRWKPICTMPGSGAERYRTTITKSRANKGGHCRRRCCAVLVSEKLGIDGGRLSEQRRWDGVLGVDLPLASALPSRPRRFLSAHRQADCASTLQAARRSFVLPTSCPRELRGLRPHRVGPADHADNLNCPCRALPGDPRYRNYDRLSRGGARYRCFRASRLHRL